MMDAVICGIYKITSPTNKIYIGSSNNITRRFRDYRLMRCKSQSKLYNSFYKHGVINHKFEIIKECSFDELYKLERQFGLELNVIGESGLNLQLPGYDMFPQIQSEETKQKKSKTLMGHFVSEETRLKQSLIRKGKPYNGCGFKNGHHLNKGIQKSPEHMEKLRLANVGRPLSEEHKKKIAKASSERIWSSESKLKISMSKLGHTVSNETREKIRIKHTGKPGHNLRSIAAFMINGDFLKNYNSITSAAKDLNIGRRSIGNNLSLISKSVNTKLGKMFFRYREETN